MDTFAVLLTQVYKYMVAEVYFFLFLKKQFLFAL